MSNRIACARLSVGVVVRRLRYAGFQPCLAGAVMAGCRKTGCCLYMKIRRLKREKGIW